MIIINLPRSTPAQDSSLSQSRPDSTKARIFLSRLNIKEIKIRKIKTEKWTGYLSKVLSLVPIFIFFLSIDKDNVYLFFHNKVTTTQ